MYLQRYVKIKKGMLDSRVVEETTNTFSSDSLGEVGAADDVPHRVGWEAPKNVRMVQLDERHQVLKTIQEIGNNVQNQ